MINIKSEKEIETLREGGRKLAYIVKTLVDECKNGTSSFYLNEKAGELMVKEGGEPSFLNYTPYGAGRPFPGNICISVNHEIVHGIPNEEEKIFKNGDIVTIDVGLVYKGLFTDHAHTLIIGPEGPQKKEKRKLLKATKEALYSGIKEAKPGNTIGDIGFAIQKIAKKYDLGIAEGLTGHGVGYGVHENPYVPNYGQQGQGEKLIEGMVIAIEPMFTLGKGRIITEPNGYTYSTKDGSLSAQFEHTVAITKRGPLILTEL